MRYDGTRAYYFIIEDLVVLFVEEGMEMCEVFIY